MKSHSYFITDDDQPEILLNETVPFRFCLFQCSVEIVVVIWKILVSHSVMQSSRTVRPASESERKYFSSSMVSHCSPGQPDDDGYVFEIIVPRRAWQDYWVEEYSSANFCANRLLPDRCPPVMKIISRIIFLFYFTLSCFLVREINLHHV
jgi:hypothetical protein